MKKIMFNDRYGLTQAVLEGRKTMTRRIVPEGTLRMAKMEAEIHHDTLERRIEDHRFYCYLDEVAIQQSYSELRDILVLRNFKRSDTIYDNFYRGLHNGDICDTEAGWNNKMFAKAKYMPHRIRITGLKVERLQDITEEGAMREGIFKYKEPQRFHESDPFAPWPPYVRPYKHNNDNLIYRCSARYAFAYLIDKIGGTGTWKSNPWVYAYTFELIR